VERLGNLRTDRVRQEAGRSPKVAPGSRPGARRRRPRPARPSRKNGSLCNCSLANASRIEPMQGAYRRPLFVRMQGDPRSRGLGGAAGRASPVRRPDGMARDNQPVSDPHTTGAFVRPGTTTDLRSSAYATDEAGRVPGFGPHTCERPRYERRRARRTDGPSGTPVPPGHVLSRGPSSRSLTMPRYPSRRSTHVAKMCPPGISRTSGIIPFGRWPAALHSTA